MRKRTAPDASAARSEDKSKLFDYMLSDGGVPMISQAPVVMECSVEDVYETKGFDNFICTIDNTYAEENVLTEEGKLDYRIAQAGVV